MRNNLFYYATSELSQDAFICWLASHAMENACDDQALRDCARHMLALFVPELTPDKVVLSKIERQVGNRYLGYIDVLLIVEHESNTYKIIVEDKTYTDEHDNQLVRYLKRVQEDYPETIVRGVYYKTGFQSDYDVALDAGYNVVTRELMVHFMGHYATKTQNNIFLDYYNYWNEFQKEVELFMTLPIEQWSWRQVNGCYNQLKDSQFFAVNGLKAGYGYVANQTGGFYGMWVNYPNCTVVIDGVEFEIYLQMETATDELTHVQLCLKLSAKDEKSDREAVVAARNHILWRNGEYSLGKYHFEKPRRLGNGRHMTIGVYDTVLENYNDIRSALVSAIEDYSRLLKDVQA